MNKFIYPSIFTAVFVFGSVAATQAAVISVAGGLSSVGGAPAIIAAPASVRPGTAWNNAIQAFDERQGFTLTSNLVVDGGVIAAGQVVSSHMIFLNSGGVMEIAHGAGSNANAVTFTFDGNVLGVISDRAGDLEAASIHLGASGTQYPAGSIGSRGMEMNPLHSNPDWYLVTGNTISLGMIAREPGDWIRVVTASPVPLPASLPLLGAALAGLGVLSRRRRATA